MLFASSKVGFSIFSFYQVETSTFDISIVDSISVVFLTLKKNANGEIRIFLTGLLLSQRTIFRGESRSSFEEPYLTVSETNQFD